MPYYKAPIIYPTGLIREDTQKINENFTLLASAFVNDDPTTGKVKVAETINGFRASQTPMPNAIPVAGPDGKISAEWFSGSPSPSPSPGSGGRYNGDSFTSDYNLQVGEEAYYYWDTNSSFTKPLRIATSGGIYQMIIVAPYQNKNLWSHLLPNNRTYPGAFTYSKIGWTDGQTTLDPESGTYSKDAISLLLAFAGGITSVLISTYTEAKFAYFIQRVTREGGGGIYWGGTRWNDTTTAWTSLGTLTTDWKNGRVIILVRRLF